MGGSDQPGGPRLHSAPPMTDRIVTFESTLAIGAAIAIHLFSQNRAAQRADWEARRAAWVHENTVEQSPLDLAARRAAWVHENTIALRPAEPSSGSRRPSFSGPRRPSFEAPASGMVAC